MNNIYDVLEICLQELENGADLEAVLVRYPELAGELRPILKASVMARIMPVSDPSPEAMRRGRAKLLQHAAQMREAKAVPRKRMIPIFQRLAISFTLAALFLTSGTGLVSASSSALPGENLYPVKLTWENIRLFFTFNEEYRETLESSFEDERLHEVNELIVEGRNETIQFTGIYTNLNGVVNISGIRVVILKTSILPAQPLVNGSAVVVKGHTNAQGFVDVESIELLPAGSVVPTGEPFEPEAENNSNGKSSNNDSGNIKEDNNSELKTGSGGGDDSGETGENVDGDQLSHDNGDNDNGSSKINDSSSGSNDDNSGSSSGEDGNGSDSGSGGGDESGSGGGDDSDGGDDGGDDSHD